MEGLPIFESEECVICLEAKPVAVFAPCRHRCSCAPCSNLVGKSRQPCPLCRTEISDVLVYRDQQAAGDVVESIPQAEVQAFKDERREEYVKKLRAPVTGDACFRGKGKLARSVATEVLSELEQRQKETAGTERMMAKRSTFLVVRNEEKKEMSIGYKVGRSKRNEVHPIMTMEEVRQDLMEFLEGGDDKLTELDLATYYPEYYWNIRLSSESGSAVDEFLTHNSMKKSKR